MLTFTIYAVSFSSLSLGSERDPIRFDRELLLDAICQVESRGNPNAVGDKGKSRGAYQIQQACWSDSRYHEPYLPNVWNTQKSRQVCRMYCLRSAGKNATNEHWARVWNGGPNGCKKKATLRYWMKVEKTIKELQKKRKNSP